MVYPRGGGGHLRYWERKLNQYDIAVTEGDNDQQAKSRTWERNFEVMDFETTRNDANDAYGSYTCYSDGSRLANHSGYGYAIKTGSIEPFMKVLTTWAPGPLYS
jgi:hypothetical protein